MPYQQRREFLRNVGQGMLVAGIGYSAALDLGLTPALAEDDSADLNFGRHEPLVRLMQDTAAEQLLPQLAAKLKAGTELRDLVAAAALANARTFGGEDYVGFHTMMALVPSYRMAQRLQGTHQALPVFKVLYRNSNRIHEHGGHASEVLHQLSPGSPTAGKANGELLRGLVRNKDKLAAEQLFATIAQQSPEEAFNELLIAVQDHSEVHRIVMPYRAWDLLDIVGAEHAHTMLRQSVRYCVDRESPNYTEHCKGGRDVLPVLLDQYKLLSRKPGTKSAEDGWLDQLSNTIFSSEPDQAAAAVAAALAEGISSEAVGEAIGLAANQLVLRDAGRPPDNASPGKQAGSVHGDSIGVHASDSANAWRNMARVSNHRNSIACLILGAHQVAFDRKKRGGDFLHWQPYPTSEHLEQVQAKSPKALLAAAEAAIKEQDQAGACAAIARYGQLGHPAAAVFQLLLGYAISEDGALHGEKYYQTVADEFVHCRPAHRWRHLLALARVTASEYGQPAAGYRQALELLDA